MRRALLLTALLLSPGAHAEGEVTPHPLIATRGELRSLWRDQQAASTGPLAAAAAWAPGRFELPRSEDALQAELRGDLTLAPWSLQGAAMLEAVHPEGGAPCPCPSPQQRAQVLELHASADLGPWQLAAGRKVVSWDVGWAWRPNDVVQQEQRRQLGPVSLAGRPLLMAEHFEGDNATSVVWVNPNRRGEAAARGADESALALRHYRREGALDLHLHARWGERTQGSLGAAAAWVGDASLEVHGSVRRLGHHDRTILDPSAPLLASRSPWIDADGGAATLALAGLTWSGARQQTVILEAWWDGTAPSAAEWSDAMARTATLQQLFVIASMTPDAMAGVAGNLAWQTTPMSSPYGQGLHRQNLYLRGSWQPDIAPAWTLSLDALRHPEDGGWLAGAGAVWQADRLSVEAALRWSGGPADSVAAQLPVHRSGVLALRWPF